MRGDDAVTGIAPDGGHHIPPDQRYVSNLTALAWAGVSAVTQYGNLLAEKENPYDQFKILDFTYA